MTDAAWRQRRRPLNPSSVVSPTRENVVQGGSIVQLDGWALEDAKMHDVALLTANLPREANPDVQWERLSSLVITAGPEWFTAVHTHALAW